jgi:hypothetical protein
MTLRCGMGVIATLQLLCSPSGHVAGIAGLCRNDVAHLAHIGNSDTSTFQVLTFARLWYVIFPNSVISPSGNSSLDISCDTCSVGCP